MSRRPRQNLPEVPFHLTARVQNGEDLLAGLEHRITRLVRSATGVHGVRPVAYAIMSNHVHLVVIQGRQPLGRFMHMLLHRIAIMVQRRSRRIGHVFQQRYHAVACADAEQLRNAIAYVHLNPVRAGMCATADQYPWTSHGTYSAPAAGDASSFELAAESTLQLFATRMDRPSDACRRDYRAFLQWRVAFDAFLACGGNPGDPLAPDRPWCAGGDVYWLRAFGDRAHRAGLPTSPPPREDIGQLARRVLQESAPDLGLGMLRSGSKARRIAQVRRLVIGRALEAGYAGHQVARFLHTSPSSVSRVAVLLRGGS
jgi:REP element-mobilizing transposase RayT